MSQSMIFQISFECWGALFCLLCCLIVFMSRNDKNPRNKYLFYALLTEAFQLVSDVLAIVFRGNLSESAYYIVRISNFSVFFCNYLTAILCCFYISTMIENIPQQKMKSWKITVSAVSILGIILLIISQFNNMFYYFDEANTYFRAKYYFINMDITILTLIICILQVIYYRKNIRKSSFVIITAYLAAPLIVGLIQIYFYGLSLTNGVNALMLVLVFMVHEVNKSRKLVEQEKELAEQQIELSDARVNILVSQIKPHFISNTLLMIQGLYNENSDRADIIMNTFISYLQENFSDLSENTPVRVSTDLSHAQKYSTIVTQRWPDMTVEFDIRCDSFFVPAMTVQPLVENAVRHGLLPLESGGEIKVTAFETDEEYCVSIVDNGVGFNVDKPEQKYKDNRKHIGISNIRDRLGIMCGGSLCITSESGKGTCAMIKIPKSEEEQEV